jgi:peptide/nickel transport system substrate-binding protein
VRYLLTRHAARTGVETRAGAVAVFLNTRVPPFDDIHVRQALHLAVDRRAVVRAAGGSTAATPTCQILPPNIPGYVRYCPYDAPDLRSARRLVAASGTRGTRVVVWAPDPFVPAARRIVALLDALGYRSALRRMPDAGDDYSRFVDSRTRAQAGVWWWGSDYPTASNFVRQTLSCEAFVPASPNNLNWAQFCRPELDARMRAAERVQLESPQLANRRWAAIDRALVDAGPWLPLYVPHTVVPLSRRVGNFRSHPITGTLVDQLWVR